MDRIAGLGVSSCAEGSRGPADAGHYTGLRPQAAHGPADAGHHAGLHTPAPQGPADDGHCTGSGTPRQLDSGSARLQPGFWLDALARACVAPALGVEPQPDGLDEIDEKLVHRAWLAFGRPIKRYLAAKAFGSWIPWHGGGIRTTVGALAAAQSVLRVEAARQCAKARRVLDRPLLVEAIRQSDLLLVHKVSSRMLAERLARMESKPEPLTPSAWP